MTWRNGECMNWECKKDGTLTCYRCEQLYCEEHRIHFCCICGEDDYTCFCEDEDAGE